MPNTKRQFTMSEFSVRGMRALENVILDLSALTVLIGANGSGKSTVVEALALLGRCSSREFFRDLQSIHGGVRSLLRHGATSITLACQLDGSLPRGEDVRVRYEIEFADTGVLRERAVAVPRDGGASGVVLFDRNATSATIDDGERRFAKSGLARVQVGPTETLLAALGVLHSSPALRALHAAVGSIQVHVGFDVTPLWIARAHNRPIGVRGADLIAPAPTVARLGANLASVYQELKNSGADHWGTTLSWVQLALGDWIEDVYAKADAGSGSVALWVKHAGLDLEIPARSLSDGQLQLLGIVAICRLRTPVSLVVFDEPETHLHPALHVRATQFFARLAESTSVVLATHSRRVLDALDKPADSVRILDIDGDASPASARIRRIDSAALAKWIDEYDGIGAVLDAGLQPTILQSEAGS